MIRHLDDGLYEVVCGWWRSLGWAVFPKDMLPKHGYVVSKDKPVIAGFLYQEAQAKFGLLGWVVSDPDSTKEERTECLDILLNHLFEKAKEEGLRGIFTFMKHGSLVEKLKTCGFTELSDDSIQLMKVF